MRVRIGCSVLTAALVLACEPRADPPRPPIPDASFDANLDVVVIALDVARRIDAPLDTPRLDTPGLDAPVSASGITIDGVLSELAWDTATSTVTSAVSGAPFTGCELTELAVLTTDTALVVGVVGNVGTVCPGAGLVVFVDIDPLAARGLFLNGTPGLDTMGSLNNVISGPLNGLASGLFPDFAWGTVATPAARTTGSLATGWRDVGSILGRFTQPTGQITTCSVSACETSITYASLGLRSGAATIQVFARLGNGTEWATPTLPAEADPVFVSTSMPVVVVVP